jgi:uncharacterized protein (DUF1697 family)
MPPTQIALLRGINVGGRNTVAMSALRELCAGLGWRDVQTYINSGNVIFRADAPPAELELALEAALASSFGLTIAVVVRPAAAWPGYLAGNPFPGESEREPNLVMLALSKAPPRPDAVDALRERAGAGEQVAGAGDALWIHYGAGAGRSKLAPALLDRLVGSPVTTRNWRTALKLAELAGAAGD